MFNRIPNVAFAGNVLWLGVCYFALQTLEALGKINKQNSGKLNENDKGRSPKIKSRSLPPLNGDRWFACANWTSKDGEGIISFREDWESVQKAVLIEAR